MPRTVGIDERCRLLGHSTLLLAAVCTYLKEPDDVVWQFIKAAPDFRVREHLCFALAAAALGGSVGLRVSVDTDIRKSDRIRSSSDPRQIFSDLLQAVGIGSLMPLAGFILLVAGETLFGMVRYKKIPYLALEQDASWKDSLSKHIGLCCACLSMVIFSITLNDRLADFLFAASALVTVVAFVLRRKRIVQPQST
jgi:hypothetical protein